MKGQLSVNPTFTNLEIRRPTLLLRDPFVAVTSHKLYLQETSIVWQSKNIINCTYSHQHNVLMILCNDWKLYIYNRNLNLIAKLSDWDSKYSVGFQYIPSFESFLLIGITEINMLKVSFKTNINETKFLTSIKFAIQKRQLKSVEECNRLSWNKGYNYNLSSGLLYVWSIQNINFYSLPKLQLRSSIVKLTKKQAGITYVHFNSHYKYTLTGLLTGNLKVWRLPLLPNSTSEYIMIHNCVYHTKPVENIVEGKDYRIVISSAADLTVCMWSLQTFELLRFYNFESEYSSIYMVDFNKAYAVQNGEMGELLFGKTMDFILEISNEISSYNKKYFRSGQEKGRIKQIQLTLESNIGFQLECSDLKAKDLNKIDVGYFYPPIKAQSIKQILSSPYESNVYYMLVETGQLFSLRLENNNGKIEEEHHLNRTLDCENHSLNQNPTLITFLPILSLEFDTEVAEHSTINKRSQEVVGDTKSQIQQQKLITVGCSKGSIVFLSLNRLDRIRTRLTYHRESIIAIEAIYSRESSNYIIASVCIEGYLRFVRFDEEKAICFLTIYCQNSLKFIYSFQERLAVVFRKGIFEIATQQDLQELNVYQNLDCINHEGQIYSLDYEPSKQLVMTCASDNKIKIWTKAKTLIYEIKVDEGLRYTIWSNDVEILVSHRSKLLYLRELPPELTQFDLSKQQFEEPKLIKTSLKDLIANWKQNQKTKQPDEIVYFKQKKKERANQSHISNEPLIFRQAKTEQARNKNQHEKLQHSFKIETSLTSKPTTKKRVVSTFSSNARSDDEERKRINKQSNLKATKKHLEEINNLKKMTNQSLLPKIQPKHEDKFEQFINAKLISKKMLTRRDITINRIIMKNLIREQFSHEDEQLSSLKLDF